MYYHIGSLEDEEKPLGVENIIWGNEEGRVKLIKCTVVCVVNFTTVVLLLSLFLWSYYNNINNMLLCHAYKSVYVSGFPMERDECGTQTNFW